MREFVTFLETVATAHPWEAYLLLGGSAFFENIFPPIPGDTVTVVGAYLVGRGALALWPVVWATFIGSTLGFMTLYALGRTLGRGALLRLKWIGQSEQRVARAERLTRRHGVLVVLANRFLPGLRSVISLAVGLLRMPVWLALPATMVSIFTWNALLIWGGLLAGENWESVIAIIGRYNRLFGIVLAAGAIFSLVIWLRRRAARRAGSRERRPFSRQ